MALVRLTFLLFIFVVLASSCSQKPTHSTNLSFEEAKSIVLEMQNIPILPPPRKLDDILVLLDKKPSQEKEQNLIRLKVIAESQPGLNMDNRDLFQFYRIRGMAQYELNRFLAARRDLHLAITFGKKADIHEPEMYRLLCDLAIHEGKYQEALQLSLLAIKGVKRGGYIYPPLLAYHSRVKVRLGNFSSAWRDIKKAKELYNKIPKSHRYSFIEYAEHIEVGNQNDLYVAEAEYLESQGLFKEAHPLRAQSLNYHFNLRQKVPLRLVRAKLALAINLQNQDRVMEAEKEARDAVAEAVTLAGKNSGIAAEAIQVLAEILLLREELENARLLSKTQLDILKHLAINPEEPLAIRATLLRAEIELALGSFKSSAQWYAAAVENLKNHSYLRELYTKGNLSMILAFIMDKRYAVATKIIKKSRQTSLLALLTETKDVPELAAFDALIGYGKEKTLHYVDEFAKVSPQLAIITHAPGSSYIKRRRAQILLQSYIAMLLEAQSSINDPAFNNRVSKEIFQISGAEHTQLKKTLSMNSARAASLIDPALTRLVREVQDAAKRLDSLKITYQNLTASSTMMDQAALGRLLNEIEQLYAARKTLLIEIENRFPKYAGLVNPQPPTFSQIQKHLRSGEALVAIYTYQDQTFSWAIPHNGNPAFAVIDIGERALQQKVNSIRDSLSPRTRFLASLPKFDISLSHELFIKLLQPVKSGWQNANHLITVVKGPLDQIPLSILSTKKVTLAQKSKVLFDEYRSIPWFIKQVSITRLPSASLLVQQRSTSFPALNRQTFIGFGDSVFNEEQLSEAKTSEKVHLLTAGMEQSFNTRGIRVTNAGKLDDIPAPSATLEDLVRLPDTADEIRRIAAALNADPVRDVYLGKDASEGNVKRADLAEKEIIAFATHALRPGDLDGLDQPALAFSSPDITGEEEDGVLTSGEIYTLQLNADLIVLSACDTGAGDNSGSESISGLGQAFFYAGGRALLVTMWPVESYSAGLLTTEMFRVRKRDRLPWPKAQQHVIRKFIQELGITNSSGKPIATYAHPFFWAPYLVVGDISSVTH